MRIATSQIYSSGVSGITTLQSSLYKLQNQMSTGKKVVTPSDDPVAAAQALLVSQASAVNDLYTTNQETATSELSTLDTTLSSIMDELQSIYSQAVAAGNGSYSDAERSDIASELSERLSNLLSLANTQDGTGRYIFSGTKSTTEPFTLNASASSATDYDLATNQYVSYNGNDSEQSLQVGASQYVSTNVSGREIFMSVKDESGSSTGQSVFDAVQNLVEYLNTSGGTASDTEYTQALTNIQASMDSLSVVQAKVGARLSSLESMTTMSENLSLQYDDQLSNLQDIDLVAATADLAQKQNQLEAAQAAFSATSQLSLFDYI